MNKQKQKVLSGIRPSGKLHVGNYLGMLKNAVNLQKEYAECFYPLVDLHSLDFAKNEKPNSKEKRAEILELAADMIAAGIDPNKSVMFQQSDVLEHANLSWILSTITYIGELERMTQYKDKSETQTNNLNSALMNYPILMTADILLYKAEVVPVGDDQKQHIELARDLAKRFNNKFGEIFPVPKAIFTKTPRIMSLIEPEKKMSKTLGDNHCLYISDEPDMIRKKVSRAVTATDSDDQMAPGVKNLFVLLENFADKAVFDKLIKEYEQGSLQYKELKDTLAESIIDSFADFREKRNSLLKDKKALEKILEKGAEKAETIASKTLTEVKEKIGLK